MEYKKQVLIVVFKVKNQAVNQFYVMCWQAGGGKSLR